MPVKKLVRELMPPVLLRMAQSLLGRPSRPSYQGVQTLANMSALHHSRFAEAYDSAFRDDPDLRPDGNRLRLRVYYAYLFAEMAFATTGDFVSVGISYGVTERVLYELLLKGTDRRFHLIDPFGGRDGAGYCHDPAAVMTGFGGDPLVRLYQAAAPGAFPLPLDRGLAFAELGTGDEDAEVASLPYLAGCLATGGVIVIDDYGWVESTSRYDEAAHRAGGSVFSLSTGQGVFVKRAPE